VNLVEQSLKRQLERQKKQIALLITAFNVAVDESELRASVACAFAWDLALDLQQSQPVSEVEYGVLARWDEAAKAVGG
jgi:hypothetical protein